MQQNLLMPTLDIQKYEPFQFGLQLTALFGPEFKWASLRHPRANVVFLELGAGTNQETAAARRIDAQGKQYVKPRDGLRWQVWNGTSNGLDAFDASQINEQFALLEIARRDAPLTASKPNLFAGTPLEPVI